MSSNSTAENSLKLLLVGGRADSFEKLSDVELLNPFSASNKCKKPKDYPKSVEGLCGDRVIFCGGYDGNNYIWKCFSFDGENWSDYGHLEHARSSASCTYLANDSFWVAGGVGTSTSSEIKFEGSDVFMNSTTLPEYMIDHSICKVNSTHLFMTGSSYDGKMAYLVNTLDPDKFEFHRLPPLLSYRYAASCGTIIRPSSSFSASSVEVIVAGRYGADESKSTSEIYSFETNEWRKGPHLPRDFYYGGYVSNLEQPLILAGGNLGLTDIIAYQMDTNIFEILPGKLDTPRRSFAMSGIVSDEDC